jgi:hypothetical protein
MSNDHKMFTTSYTRQQQKNIFFKYIFMLKLKQFIIIYVNVCMKRVYPHKTNKQ